MTINKELMMSLQKQRSEVEHELQILSWAHTVDQEAGKKEFSLQDVAKSVVARLEAIDKEIIEVATGKKQ